MPLTTTGRNKLLDSGKSVYTYVGALTSVDGTEVAGGSYARQAVTWTAASAGLTENNGAINIPIPGSPTTVQALALYDANAAGNMLAYGPIGSSGLLRGIAEVTDTTNNILTSAGHGLSADNRVMIWQVADEAFPSATPSLLTSVLYYVTSITTDTFKLSTTAAGANIVDITTGGSIAWAKTVPETWANAGNLTVNTGALDLSLTFA